MNTRLGRLVLTLVFVLTAGLVWAEQLACDLDGDGKCTLADYAKFQAAWPTAPPQPTPTPPPMYAHVDRLQPGERRTTGVTIGVRDSTHIVGDGQWVVLDKNGNGVIERGERTWTGTTTIELVGTQASSTPILDLKGHDIKIEGVRLVGPAFGIVGDIKRGRPGVFSEWGWQCTNVEIVNCQIDVPGYGVFIGGEDIRILFNDILSRDVHPIRICSGKKILIQGNITYPTTRPATVKIHAEQNINRRELYPGKWFGVTEDVTALDNWLAACEPWCIDAGAQWDGADAPEAVIGLLVLGNHFLGGSKTFIAVRLAAQNATVRDNLLDLTRALSYAAGVEWKQRSGVSPTGGVLGKNTCLGRPLAGNLWTDTRKE